MELSKNPRCTTPLLSREGSCKLGGLEQLTGETRVFTSSRLIRPTRGERTATTKGASPRQPMARTESHHAHGWRASHTLNSFVALHCAEHQNSGFSNKLDLKYRVCCIFFSPSNAPGRTSGRFSGGSWRRCRCWRARPAAPPRREVADGGPHSTREARRRAANGSPRPPEGLWLRRCCQHGR